MNISSNIIGNFVASNIVGSSNAHVALVDLYQQISVLESQISTYNSDTDYIFKNLNKVTDNLHNLIQRDREQTQIINNILSSVMSNGSGTSNLNSRDTVPNCICSICLTNQRDCVLEPCMHVCCCVECLKILPNNKCPVCRSPIDYYMKLYIS